jgi:plasmid stability protein
MHHFDCINKAMKTMTIRNLPEEVYSGLQDMARSNHRSLQEQVRLMLIEEVRLRRQSVCEQAGSYRARLIGRISAKSVVDDIKEDRTR